MREDGIAHSMLQALRQELATRPAVKVRRLLVRVGELTGVDPGELERSFETLTSGTEMASLDVEIEPCPRRHKCSQCGTEFTVICEEYHCPSCRSRQTTRIAGFELELSFVDSEDV